MSPSDRHRLTYVDLHPEPLERAQAEPSALVLLGAAAVVCAALWALALFLFTL